MATGVWRRQTPRYTVPKAPLPISFWSSMSDGEMRQVPPLSGREPEPVSDDRTVGELAGAMVDELDSELRSGGVLSWVLMIARIRRESTRERRVSMG